MVQVLGRDAEEAMLVAAIRESLIEAGEAEGLQKSAAQLQPPDQESSAHNGLSSTAASGAVANSGSSTPDDITPLSHQVCRLARV